jgi:hypothetical protein
MDEKTSEGSLQKNSCKLIWVTRIAYSISIMFGGLNTFIGLMIILEFFLYSEYLIVSIYIISSGLPMMVGLIGITIGFKSRTGNYAIITPLLV